jgi:hypothetical protein
MALTDRLAAMIVRWRIVMRDDEVVGERGDVGAVLAVARQSRRSEYDRPAMNGSKAARELRNGVD